MATVVLEIPVAARISMLERLDSSQGTDNNDGAFRTIRARPSGKRETSDSRQKTMNLQSGSSACLQDKIKPRRREGDSGTSKGGRSTTFISKTKYHLVKMTGEQFEKGLLVEDLYPKFRGSYINKHFESMATSGGAESEDSSSQGSGICDKRLSLLSGLSHSDYETCGSQTSLEDYDNDRLSTSSGLLVKDDFNSSSSSSSFSLNKLSQVSDGRTSRPVSSVLGDSEFDELESYTTYSELEEQSKSEEGQSGHKSKPERPACLDQGMAATVAWIKNELSEMRTQDQSLMRQFMDIQGKIRNLKVQQQQRQKQNLMMRKQSKQHSSSTASLAESHSCDLLGNHRFSWELDSLYEEDEYYDYDTEDDLDCEEDFSTVGASGYS